MYLISEYVVFTVSIIAVQTNQLGGIQQWQLFDGNPFATF
jgi:hypothetical protein